MMKSLVKSIDQSENWAGLNAAADWVVEEAVRIQQIPAPSFHEAERAAYVAAQFRALGLSDVDVDEVHNAYGCLRGSEPGRPALLLIAHTDTVFAADTDLTIQREGRLIYGPGLGDNSLGVAALLGALRWFQQHGQRPACDLWCVATSCEEGLGNLRGIRAAFARLRDRIAMGINLEGLAFGHVYHAGIAVQRLHIIAEAEGGHSWLHFGRSSAVHGILELGARLTRMPVSRAPRSTFNVGMIEGGQAINAIATRAGLWLDLRSEGQVELERMNQYVERIVTSLSQPDLRFKIEVVGSRPAGTLDPDHVLVQGAMAALEQVQTRGALETGSTDANIPLYAGCPMVTVGVTRGGNAHRLDEYIELGPVPQGLRQILLLVKAAAQYQERASQSAAD